MTLEWFRDTTFAVMCGDLSLKGFVYLSFKYAKFNDEISENGIIGKV